MNQRTLVSIQVSALNAAKSVCSGISIVATMTPVVRASGSGYVIGDIITVAGGASYYAAAAIVRRVDNLGAVLEVDVTYGEQSQGAYTTKPSSPASVTGGTGTGATFTLAWSDNVPPDGARFAVVQANAQNVRYRGDGTAPTSTTGLLLVVKATGVGDLILEGAEMHKVSFIEVTASATLSVSFRK